MYAIDVHAHVFPDQIAEKAIPALSSSANIKPYGKGTVTDLLQKMDQAGVKKSVLVSVATRASQVQSINNWLLEQKNERLIPFAALHPEDPQRFEEIQRVKKLGFKGFKMHGNYQEFYPDETRVIELAKAIADAGLILLMHGGVDWAYEEEKASPERMARLMEAVPNLKLIIAHFGGFQSWDKVEKILAGSPAYFDISFTLPYIKQDDFLRIARKHGVNKLLFGTDYPWAGAEENLEILDQYPLNQEEKEAILFRNAETLLDLASS